MVLGRQNHVPADVKNPSYSSESVSKCVPDRHSVKGPGLDA